MIRADSEVFAAVVRAQLAGGDDDYPNHLERFRYDPRPYGTPSGYPEVFSGVQGIDPTLSFGRAGESAMDQLIDNRKEILKMSDVPAGRALSYPQCAGVGVPLPPPPRGSRSAARSKRADVHAGCPKTPEYYLTVGLPIRGQPEGLWNARDTRGRRVALRGDVWTALVDQYSAGPKDGAGPSTRGCSSAVGGTAHWSWPPRSWFQLSSSGDLRGTISGLSASAPRTASPATPHSV